MSGCASSDQIEFQGKIFEMAGMTNRQKKEHKLKERVQLVIPPTRKLPQPGPRQAVATPENWPVDPDEVDKEKTAKEKRRLEKYYRDGDFSDKAGIEEYEHITGQWERRPGMISKTVNEVIKAGRKAADEDAAAGHAPSQ